MGIKLSVIIVSYKEADILRDCLDSVKKYNDIGDGLEVIVSDNSPDDTLYNTVVKEYGWVKAIKNENKGFGAGNNRGYEISSGEYLLFLNPDTVLTEPVFGFAVKEFERDKDLALFGVQLIRRDGGKNASFFAMDRYGILSVLQMKINRRRGKYRDGKMFIAGADMFVRRSAFESAGLFDENIFMYKEEADLIKRIKLNSPSKKTAFFGGKRIIHLEGGTEQHDIDRIVNQYARILDSDEYYAKKWNVSLKSILKSKRRFQKFKLFVCGCMFKRDKVKLQKRIISLLNERISRAES